MLGFSNRGGSIVFPNDFGGISFGGLGHEVQRALELWKWKRAGLVEKAEGQSGEILAYAFNQRM